MGEYHCLEFVYQRPCDHATEDRGKLESDCCCLESIIEEDNGRGKTIVAPIWKPLLGMTALLFVRLSVPFMPQQQCHIYIKRL